MATDYSRAGLWSRPAAVLYILTVGLVIGVAVTVIGTLYGIVGTLLRLANYGDVPNPDTWTRRPISGPVSDVITWWGMTLNYAILGRGQFMLAPEIGGYGR